MDMVKDELVDVILVWQFMLLDVKVQYLGVF